MDNSINICELLTKKAKSLIKRFDAIAFLLTFALSILVHAYMFTNKFLNHDDLGSLFGNNDFGIRSGRWALQFFTGLTGNFSSPWVIGIFSSALLGLTVVFISHIFKIKHYPSLFCISLCIVAFPSVAATFTYMFCASSYIFSLLLSCAAAYFIKQKAFWKTALGIALLTISIGIYQTYVALTIALIFFSFIIELAQNQYEGKFIPVIKDVAKYIVSIILSLIFYYAILKLCLYTTGNSLESYQGISGMFQLGTILERLSSTLGGALYYYKNGIGIYSSAFTKLVIISFILDAVVIVKMICQNKLYKNPLYIITIVLWGLVSPLVLGCAYLMTSTNVHQVMMFYVIISLILPAVLADGLNIKPSFSKLKKALAIGLATLLLAVQLFFGYEFVLVTNRCYFSMDLTAKSTLAYYSRVAQRIEALDGFSPECHIVLIGYPDISFNIPSSNITGDNVDGEALKVYSRHIILQTLVGANYTIYNEGPLAKEIRQTEEFKSMPCYPADNSIQKIDGKIVVKFSE